MYQYNKQNDNIRIPDWYTLDTIIVFRDIIRLVCNKRGEFPKFVLAIVLIVYN